MVDYIYSKCSPIPISDHQEYFLKGYMNDHKYHCLSRSDEDTILESDTSIDYHSILPCHDECGNTGNEVLLCGDTCVGTELWCNPDSPWKYPCGGFTTVDQVLCSNKTF